MNKLIHVEQGAQAGPAPGAREARTLSALYDDAQHGLRRVISLGLFAHEIKAKLKHGQFGPWLAEHCPHLAREIDGRHLASKALSAYMALAYGVLETAGMKLGQFLEEAAKITAGDLSHGGEILTLPEAKLPQEAKPLREKLCALIDGKTQRQLFAEFKTAEDADEGEGIKVGSPLGKHHPRKAKPPTPEEQLKAKIEVQEQQAQSLIADIRALLRADTTLVRGKVWQAVLDIGVELTTTARQRLKADSKQSRKRNAPHVSHTIDTLKQLK